MKDLETRARTKRAMQAVRQVEAQLRVWDPIGVMVGESSPMDEYDTYAPHIVSLLAAGAAESEIAAHLGHIRTATIGLSPDPSRDLKCAEQILATWRQRDEPEA